MTNDKWLGWSAEYTPGTLPDGSNLYDRIQQQYADVAVVKETSMLSHDEIELLKRMLVALEERLEECGREECEVCSIDRDLRPHIQQAKEILERLENAE